MEKTMASVCALLDSELILLMEMSWGQDRPLKTSVKDQWQSEKQTERPEVSAGSLGRHSCVLRPPATGLPYLQREQLPVT